MAGTWFGGKRPHSSSTDRRVPARHNTSSDSAADAPEQTTAFAGRHFEGLGDVWDAFFPGGGKTYRDYAQRLIAESRACGPAVPRPDGSLSLLIARPPVGGVGVHSYILIKGDRSSADFTGGYPFLEGAPMRAVLEESYPWANGLSGSVALTSKDGRCRLACFLAAFFLHVPVLTPGRELDFRVAALACSLKKEEPHGAQLGNPAPPAFSGKAALLPLSVADMYAFQLPVLGWERVECLEHAYVRIRTLFSGGDGQGQPGFLYASAHVLNGYVPQVGDEVTGLLWMQCSLEQTSVPSA